jgi:GNAT superfamily N-acetyltransferase
MQVRPAQIADADEAVDVLRRSIHQLCALDHKGDPATLAQWLANKTADNMRQWIAAHTVLVAVEGGRIAGVASLRHDGHVLLNYVAPEARFTGASKALIQEIEALAVSRGLKRLTLESTATALRFYLSDGWTATGPPQPGFGLTMGQPMGKAIGTGPAT